MKIIALDNEKTALNILRRAIEDVTMDCEIRAFQKASLAFEEVSEKKYIPDVAFLDIEMPNMSGLQLAMKLKKICPKTNIVFVTGFSDYALDAYQIRSSGYILKPVTAELVKKELDNLRNPIKIEQNGKLKIHTFGDFEVYIGDEKVRFINNKSKEIFAYLIDNNGKSVMHNKLAGALWNDGIYDNSRQEQLYSYIRDLIKSLSEVEKEDIIINKKDEISVDVSKLDCDMYNFCKGDINAINAYRGKYMSAYSWAKFSDGRLTNAIEDKNSSN